MGKMTAAIHGSRGTKSPSIVGHLHNGQLAHKLTGRRVSRTQDSGGAVGLDFSGTLFWGGQDNSFVFFFFLL